MKKKKKGFLLAFPAISGFLFFYLIPFLIVLWYSVSFGIGKREFVGLDNYKELFKNTMFLLAVKNTCKYMLVTIPVTLGTALCISVILQQITKGQKIFRLSFLYPIIMPIASIVLVIQFFFNNLQNLNYQKVSASATIITVFILFLSGLIYMIYYFLKRRTADA